MIYIYILCFLTFPLVFLLILINSLRKRDSIKFDILWGKRCWYCKEALTEHIQYLFTEKKEKLKCCTTCQRHLKIIQIRSPFRYLITRIHKFIISDRYNKFISFLVFFNLLLLCIYILFTFFLMNYFLLIFIPFFLFNNLFWLVLILNQHLTSIEKEKPSK